MKLRIFLFRKKKRIGLIIILLFGIIFSSAFLYVRFAYGVTRTWDGGGTTNDWSDCANWSSDTCPGSSDIATFDGTSSKDATIDASFGGSVAGVNITAGYSGTITQSIALSVGTSSFSMAGGVWTGGSNNITSNKNFTLSGGTFTSSGTLTLDDILNNNSQTISCTGTFPMTVDAKFDTFVNGTYVIGSGCEVTEVADDTQMANIQVDGTLNAGNMTTARSVTVNGTLNSSGTLTLNDQSNSTTQTISCTGTFPMTVDAKFDTFVNGTYVIGSGCEVTEVANDTQMANIQVDGTLNAGNMTTARSVTVNGTLNSSGTLTLDDQSNSATQTISCTGTFPMTVDAKFDTFNTGTLDIGSGCTVAESAADAVDGNVTVHGTWNPNNTSVLKNLTNIGTINITGSLTFYGTTQSSTVTCTSPDLVGNVVLNKTSTGTLTLGSDCTVTGNFTRTDGQIANPASAYTFSVQGDVSLSQTDTIGGVNLTVELSGNGNQTISQNASMTISSPLNVNKTGGTASLGTSLITGSTCGVSGGTFNLNGQAFTCGSTFTVGSGGTLQLFGDEATTVPTLASGSTVKYTGNGDSNADTYPLYNWSYSNLTIASTDSGDTFTTAQTLTTNLQGYWPMDEASWTNDCSTSTVLDSSGNSNDGTSCPNSTGPTGGVTGHHNNGGFFDDTDDYVQLPNSGSLNLANKSFSITLWTKRTASGVNDWAIAQGTNSTDNGLHIGYRLNDTFRFGFFSDDLDTSAYTDVGEWHYWTVTYNAATNYKRIYRDGVLVKEGASGADYAGTGAMKFGYRSYGTVDRFGGSLDEIRVYDRVLKGTEISSLYGDNTSNAFSTLSIPGNFTLSGGIFSAPATFNVSGDFAHTGGTFTNNSGVVNLSGSGIQNISGSTTFYDLTATGSSSKVLVFAAGSTQTISHTLTFTGTANTNRMPLRSSTTGTQWNIASNGTENVSYVSVRDSNACSGNTITPVDSQSSGNNSCWVLGSTTHSVDVKRGVTIRRGATIRGN